ncbi:hypothetical protein MKW98_026031 [Papaver atlanticum]|uniref:Cullin family profile domain-containing protein n=1 Tax=Papaver atlanticum TaxID=357466 RepID=A0AAD4RXY1_9MAGN|nr:hypothetical protein MKW98_026031 [Papaver atlanticum]
MAERPIITLDAGWSPMEQGIAKLKRILANDPDESQFDSDTYMQLYTTIYNMSTQKPPNDHSAELYERYIKTFEVYLNSTVRQAIREKHGVFMLRELVNRWTNHQVMVKWLSRFFFYLDRYFLPRRSLPSLKGTGLNCFYNYIYESLKVPVKDVIISLINQEREGDEIDRTMLKHALELFVLMGDKGVGDSLDCYVNDFETAFLTDTADYYTRKASLWIQEDSCPDYMIKAEERLKREKDSVSHYLHSSTEEKLLEKVQHHLLLNNAQQLFEKEHSGCHVLLKDDKNEDLERMYRLFSSIKNGLDPLSAAFKQHVTSEGMSLIQQAGDAVTTKRDDKAAVAMQEQAFIRRVIELHDKYYAYVTISFKKDNLFHKALKEAFEVFCNKKVGNSLVAELLSTFSDGILRKGGSNEKLDDDAIEESLDKIVCLLSYLDDKDLFSEFCKKKLARRLLFDKNSADDNHERSFLSKLKQQCGAQFTSKMEGMINDLETARDMQNRYKEDYTNKYDYTSNDIFNVTVLTTGYWPTYKTIDLRLPLEMAECVQSFKKFYQVDKKNRKLTFLYSMGSCNGTGKFQKKPIELIVSTHQAAVLVLFNSSDKLSYSEIREQLNLTDDDVVRLLHSLSCAKYKILAKEPNTRIISQEDSFSWNVEFTDKMRRIKIPLPPVDEKKKVIEDVDKDRRYAIDASIVRIMKARKVLQYNDLVTACVEQLSRMFKPDFKVIKKRIEDLISREFLEREEGSANTFRYLA